MNNLKRTPLSMIRGDTVHLDIHVCDANGRPWTLAENEKLIFGIKSKENAGDYLVKKTVESGASPFRVTLCPADTLALELGLYHYDAGLQSGEDFYHAIPVSSFTVCSSITKWEDPV